MRRPRTGKLEVDDYLAGVGEPERSALKALRAQLRTLLPTAEEGISYGMPVFKLGGKAVAGYAAFERHCSYFPHSGSVLGALGQTLAKYSRTKSALHFSAEKPLPLGLLRKLLKTRLAEIERRQPARRRLRKKASPMAKSRPSHTGTSPKRV